MEEIHLDAQIRDQIGRRNIKAVRRGDFVPAIVYGEKKDPTPIKVDRRAYEKIMRHHRGESVIFRLNVLEGDRKLKDYSVIVKEEQHEPVSDGLLHIDFRRISLTQEIEVKVQVATKGDPIGVRRDGGSLDHALWELDVICLPTKIPQKIEIDVSHLEIGDAIHVKDIALPEGVKTKHDPEAILVSVVPPMREVQAPAEGAEVAEPEVIKEKKEQAAAEEKTEEKGEKKTEEKKDEKKKEEKKS